MIVRNIDSLHDAERKVTSDNWSSTRLLLKDDGMGFSFHQTTVFPKTETKIWYKHHLEAVFCLEGVGEIEEEDGTRHEIHPGTIYALDKHDKHVLRAFSEMKMICVFNPPLVGPETHDTQGVYPLLTEK
ncbi:ectoine synthase [Nitrosopumilus maritimus]|uniref:L-ectoine synthase n=1 Tax=Nitrosopumilus maritimus (strain SCM1) TaxID=436308 RepID=A9A2K1_NITMS|nr:ectoine synthase [Nitrosopumilus maritimus]ABX13240.1 Ectoine synthase [Nitrosopumilus maritimus SCM1]ALC77329.1 ectoine synthase [synthetic construct]